MCDDSCNKISVVKQLEPEEDLWLVFVPGVVVAVGDWCRWQDLARRVERDELDLVLHLGDQVYYIIYYLMYYMYILRDQV